MSTSPGRKAVSQSSAAARPPVRCAIYTRKSTEEGLEQEFNSLHAQRESGESYIASMRHEGWVCLPHCFDDGGYTGGNIERPALKRLLSDIEAGHIDCVVVYKVDRLSRSLLDFARLMEIFDRKKITFVSVTQQFNTVHSMGRLTLNILLSFAQFEREIISERTRDKIAAARRKGKWAGGKPVLGYDLSNGRLVVRSDEAEQVRGIFEMYLQKRSLLATAAALNDCGWTTKRVVSAVGKPWGGSCWDKVRVYKLLTNPVFIGQVQHKDEVYPGEHEAIVPLQVWQRVQVLLKTHGIRGGSLARNKHGALLRGLLHCKTCDCPMGHVFTVKGGRMALQVHANLWNGMRRRWSDTAHRPLEKVLNSFLAGIVKVAVAVRGERLDRERRDRQFRDRHNRRQELIIAQQREQECLARLDEEVLSWKKAKEIRAYVEAVRTMGLKAHGQIDSGSKLDQWMTWAMAQADRYDPLVKSPPSILDEEVPSPFGL